MRVTGGFWRVSGAVGARMLVAVRGGVAGLGGCCADGSKVGVGQEFEAAMVEMTPEAGGPYSTFKTVVVRMPERSPYDGDAEKRARYRHGYAFGYMDGVNLRYKCRSNVGEVATKEWNDGWLAGHGMQNGER